jgi:lysophospholipase L1-like esterase
MFKKITYFKTILSKILNKIFLLIIVLISIALTLYFCNFVLNFFNYQPQYNFYDFATNGDRGTYSFDPNLIYRFKTDELYRNYKVPVSSGEKLAMVGDSVTWSFGASESATYPQNFEYDYLQKHPNSSLKVYNYGVPGYGLDQEYVLIQNKILPELKPAVIVWNINENDLRDSNYLCLFRYQNNQWIKISGTHNLAYWYNYINSKLPSQITNSALYKFIFQITLHLITSTIDSSVYTFGCSSIVRDNNNDASIIKRFTYFLQTLQKQSKNLNFHLVVTIVPFQKYFNNQFNPNGLDIDYLLLKNAIKNTGVDFLDFNQNILDQLQKQISLPNSNFSQQYFLDASIDQNPDGMRHPNQKLYNLMSNDLVDFIDKLHLTL